ncbi:Vegetative incompatibility protein [Lachnellula occidentalis]|uniref:Vegetative incompatibility protein n=1 Tax=Lachnellula occidentalis TaxID=215460 RepID=A0A8H8S540_9HELO|nr:Vegetative incompatibility protein [Lachnellula occidentalis]
MAEVLGVAASVAGLISLADIVVGRGYKFLKAIKNAEKTVKSLVHEVNVLSGVLHGLSNTIQLLEEDEGSAAFDPTTQVHYIEACYQTLLQIQSSFEAALPSSPLSIGQKIRWPLKQPETKELLADVQRHKSTMVLAMSSTEMSTLFKVLARQDSIQDGIHDLKSHLEADRDKRKYITIDRERLKMLDFLTDVNAQTWQDSNIRLRQPGTGIWFTDGPKFKTWRSEANTKLWIYGIPGAGKTILVSSIIQELEKMVDPQNGIRLTLTPCHQLHKLTPGLALAFFYCDYKDLNTQKPLAILGSLARQLMVQNEECFQYLTTFYQDHVTKDRQVRPSTPEELCDLIVKASAQFQNTMIVVDGLDEISENRADITRFLRGLNDPSRSIKTLFASRPEVDIGYVLADSENISIAAMGSDLRLYVGSEIERRTRQRKLNIKDRDLKEHIMKTLVEGADGMFRWVACQMDYLCECSSDRDRRQALKQLPPDLPSSYERILERVNRSNKQNQRLVRNALHWIVYAEVSYTPNCLKAPNRTGARGNRPLTTTQLLQALAVQSGDTVFDSSGTTTEEELLHWCSSLVRRNRSSTGLELAHFTVKEFLISSDLILQPQYIEYRLSGDHSLLAEACVTFLSCTSFDDQSISSIDPGSLFPTECFLKEVWEPFKDKFDFFEYAASQWIAHLRQCKSVSIHETVNQLFTPERSSAFRLWTHVWFENNCNRYENKYFIDYSDPTPLHWAACFALNDVCVDMIKLGMDVEEDSKFGRPLNCALKLTQAWDTDHDTPETIVGQKETIQVLLNAGANIRAEVGVSNWAGPRLTAFQLALEADLYLEEPFAATKIMLDSGCTILSEDFDPILIHVDEFHQFDEDYPGFCPENASQIMETFADGFRIYLKPSVYLGFFSFALQMLSLGCEGKHFSSLFNLTFPEAFPFVVHQELSRLVCLSKTEITLIQLLCQLICTLSDNPETTKTIFQDALTRAIQSPSSWVAKELLEMNKHWDASFAIGGTADLRSLLDPKKLSSDCHWIDGGGNRDGDWNPVIESLIVYGANVTERDVFGFSPLEMCIKRSWDCEIFQLLWNSTQATQYYASLDTECLLADTERLLDLAVVSTNREVADFIVQKLCDKRILSEAQWIELAIAKNTSVIWDALALRDFSDTELDRQFPLHVRARPHISLESYEILLEEGTNRSLQDLKGNTPLHDLTQTHEDVSFEKMKLTLKAVVDLDISNHQHLTPLALAIRCKNIPATQLLLEAGANPDLPLDNQETALHLACWIGNTDGAKLLLEKGCNPSPQDSRGQTPKDIALTCSYTTLANMIQNAIDQGSRVPPENADDVEMSGKPIEDFHGNLPLRMA